MVRRRCSELKGLSLVESLEKCKADPTLASREIETFILENEEFGQLRLDEQYNWQITVNALLRYLFGFGSKECGEIRLRKNFKVAINKGVTKLKAIYVSPVAVKVVRENILEELGLREPATRTEPIPPSRQGANTASTTTPLPCLPECTSRSDDDDSVSANENLETPDADDTLPKEPDPISRPMKPLVLPVIDLGRIFNIPMSRPTAQDTSQVARNNDTQVIIDAVARKEKCDANNTKNGSSVKRKQDIHDAIHVDCKEAKRARNERCLASLPSSL